MVWPRFSILNRNSIFLCNAGLKFSIDVYKNFVFTYIIMYTLLMFDVPGLMRVNRRLFVNFYCYIHAYE